MHNNSQRKKQEVEDQRRSVKLSKNKTSITACNDSLNAKTLNEKSISAMCDKCVLHDKHDMCALKSVAKPLKDTVALEANKKLRNFTRKLYERVSKTCSCWYPKFTPSGYKWNPKSEKEKVNPNLVEIVLFIVDSGCSKHMTGNIKLLINFVKKFLGTVKFGNDQITPILGYGDLVTKMPKATTTDVSLTKSYIPKVSKIPDISPTIAKFYKPIENHNIHEGRVVDQAYYKSNNIERQTRRPRSDRGKARHSVSSSSSHHQGTSSHQHNDDDVKTSRASTPSPTTYLNSLHPLNYQNYHVPSSSEQTNETLFA
nr:integrase, catalytic region, zinc finger, CCHC-type, peptidase aspartic, catalytic [Tanacetum cinerariifolium]